MNTVTKTLRRIFADDRDPETEVHFHRRGEVAEPCYDKDCRIPRLTV